jgi:hypothetical protein
VIVVGTWTITKGGVATQGFVATVVVVEGRVDEAEEVDALGPTDTGRGRAGALVAIHPPTATANPAVKVPPT